MLFELELNRSKYYDKTSAAEYKKLGFEFTLIAKKFYIVNEYKRVVEFESLKGLEEWLCSREVSVRNIEEMTQL